MQTGNDSRLWEQKIEKHEIQKIGCDGGPKAVLAVVDAKCVTKLATLFYIFT